MKMIYSPNHDKQNKREEDDNFNIDESTLVHNFLIEE